MGISEDLPPPLLVCFYITWDITSFWYYTKATLPNSSLVPLGKNIRICFCKFQVTYLHFDTPIGVNTYPQAFYISLTLESNKIVHHYYIFILDLRPDLIGMRKDNCKTGRETFKFGDLMSLISEFWR